MALRLHRSARAAIGPPVGTAETWHVWLAHPELAQHVDFIGVHLLPYWEGVPVEQAVNYSLTQFKRLQQAFPHKPIVITEIGWPSRGRTRESAVASDANEALFLRRFLYRAHKAEIVYYVMEAFDQPWKAYLEGAVGSYWGVYDVNRHPKFAFTAPIVRVPEWHILAAISVAVALVVLGLLYLNSEALRNRGRTFLAVVVYAAATLAVWVIYDFTQQYMTVSSVIAGVLLLLGMLGVLLVLLAEAHEWAEAHWVQYRRRLGAPLLAHTARPPKVSIHVPAYNEPAGMVIETLDALARLDYPDFEVLVIDNNTRDERVWRPVEAHCAALGARFRFFHLAPLAGFKAGALNYALERTAPDAEIVAVIDSDYVVDARWLRDLTPAFEDQRVAIVQAPQDYRDAGQSAFKAMCYAEYRGFFHIGMITRNERNAIIQHGTMTLVRRTCMEEMNGWAKEGVPVLIGGDFNVIPEDIDCHKPSSWMHDALFQPEPRARYRELLGLGYTDAFRSLHPGEGGQFTFWDYFRQAFEHNRGIRIDHIMLSPQAADHLITSGINKHMRGREKPSDHVPVWCELDI